MRSHISYIALFLISRLSRFLASSQLARASSLHNSDMWAVVVVVSCFIFLGNFTHLLRRESLAFRCCCGFYHWLFNFFYKNFLFRLPVQRSLRQHRIVVDSPLVCWVSQELVLRKHSLFTCNISHKFVKLIHSGFWLNGSLHSSVRNSKRRQAGSHTLGAHQARVKSVKKLSLDSIRSTTGISLSSYMCWGERCKRATWASQQYTGGVSTHRDVSNCDEILLRVSWATRYRWWFFLEFYNDEKRKMIAMASREESWGEARRSFDVRLSTLFDNAERN